MPGRLELHPNPGGRGLMARGQVCLRRGEDRELRAGKLWVYDNEIAKIEGEFENGDVVEVHDFDGYVMGKGFINTNSKLTVRMLSRRKDAVIDKAFMEQRVRDAWNYRKEVLSAFYCTTSYALNIVFLKEHK